MGAAAPMGEAESDELALVRDDRVGEGCRHDEAGAAATERFEMNPALKTSLRVGVLSLALIAVSGASREWLLSAWSDAPRDIAWTIARATLPPWPGRSPIPGRIRSALTSSTYATNCPEAAGPRFSSILGAGSYGLPPCSTRRASSGRGPSENRCSESHEGAECSGLPLGFLNVCHDSPWAPFVAIPPGKPGSWPSQCAGRHERRKGRTPSSFVAAIRSCSAIGRLSTCSSSSQANVRRCGGWLDRNCSKSVGAATGRAGRAARREHDEMDPIPRRGQTDFAHSRSRSRSLDVLRGCGGPTFANHSGSICPHTR